MRGVLPRVMNMWGGTIKQAFGKCSKITYGTNLISGVKVICIVTCNIRPAKTFYYIANNIIVGIAGAYDLILTL